MPLPAFANIRRDGLIEPELRIAPGGAKEPRVAMTLDACMGEVDPRILDTLVEHRIPATLFVTGRWLRNNAEALITLKAHPDLFQLENHGAMHIPAVTGSEKLYGIAPAGTLAAVQAEVDGGAEAMAEAGIGKPTWYRDATALYSGDALLRIRQMGYRIAGFSLNADFGASLPAPKVVERMLMAKDGDVIIGHINQPKRSSGAGISAGLIALRAKGFTFVRLQDVPERDAWGEIVADAAPTRPAQLKVAIHKAKAPAPFQ
ncbi:MAG TPA: polysaccharide deacetylase family protein [Devosiaceae bacterium]|nr:polysaccharide deacetylase family protein [Devosiaceae bacterium]